MLGIAWKRIVALGVVSMAACRTPSGDDTLALFNGRDLAGWRQVGDALWTVAGGELVGASADPEGCGALSTLRAAARVCALDRSANEFE